MNDTVRQFRNFFVSLKLTVVLLVLSMLLVFFATLDQVNLGVWGIQQKWFHSLFVLQNVHGVPVPIYPGGYLLGGFLLVNLISAHVYRFKLSWRKSGIFLTHAGLILLLIGELISGILQRDFQMRLAEGETKNYAESDRYNELAIIDTTDAKFDDVTAIPESRLAHKDALQIPALPFRVVTREYFPNSVLHLRAGATGAPPSPATMGVGPKLIVSPAPITYKQDDRNWPSAFVELIGPDGSLGTWLVTPQLPVSQTFDYAGHHYRIGMRYRRVYKPFSLTLLKVGHDVYPGTDIPKNFSSRLRLTTPGGEEGREVLIYMNNPLRYAGLTFYQYQMDSANNTSVLQVVHNPGWLLPYISCALMALGLVVQFSLHLVGFIGKRRRAVSI
jgi:hypothetical protein